LLGDNNIVARADSDDLRSKMLRAYERGRFGLEALAEQFGGSYGSPKKIRRQPLPSGRVERSPQSRSGPVSRGTRAVEEQWRSARRRQPDLTLPELGERLAQSRQLRLSRTRWWEVRQRLGLRRKKNRSTPARRTAHRRSRGGKSGGKREPKAIRQDWWFSRRAA
jgi:transposase